PLSPTLFPYTTLFRSHSLLKLPDIYWSDDGSRPAVLPGDAELSAVALASLRGQFSLAGSQADDRENCPRRLARATAESSASPGRDRKSTRLNSSHVAI